MLNANQFKFHLARYAKVSEADAAAFVDALTQTLLDQVKAGEEVTIQGLGTFSVIATQQGRRLAFQVDERMRAAVNAPFACFEPMVVGNAPRPIGDDDNPKESEVKSDVAEEPVSPSEPESHVAEPDPDTEPEPAPAPTPLPAESENKDDDVVPKEAESASGEVPEQGKNRVAETSAAIGGIVASISASAEEKSKANEVKKAEQPQPSRQKRYEEPSAFDVLKEKLQNVKPWMWGAAGGAVVLLVVLVMLLKPSDKPKPSAKTDVAKTEVVSDSASAVNLSEKVDEMASEPTPSAEKTTATRPASNKSVSEPSATSPSRKSSSKPTDEMLLMENGKPKMATLGDGGRLTLVALREYGDKAFWAYIYDVNAFQLGDPNNVPIGLPLYLPNPSYFRIDANDVKSVKRAQNRAMQILNAAK